MKFTAKDIAYNGVLAALYVVLTLLTYPFSFLGMQIRIAEILVFVCFFRKDYTIGLVVGCALANLFSPIGLMDALFGTLSTLLSCLCIMFCKHLLVATIFPIVFNSFIVGFEIYYFVGQNSYFVCVGMVALGETIAIIIGYILFMVLKRNTKLLKFIRAKQNVDFKF